MGKWKNASTSPNLNNNAAKSATLSKPQLWPTFPRRPRAGSMDRQAIFKTLVAENRLVWDMSPRILSCNKHIFNILTETNAGMFDFGHWKVQESVDANGTPVAHAIASGGATTRWHHYRHWPLGFESLGLGVPKTLNPKGELFVCQIVKTGTEPER